MVFRCAPSDLPKLYWKRTLDDLRRMTGLFIRYEMVKAMSVTESLLFVTEKLFGKAEPEAEDLNGLNEMMAFARAVNG